eukprot:TRINITY_DN34012_c0_g1_i1.p1 TRINITY_DN34012_c0_g1~~TRINITY_DN34012_c0_g1_i1.p1  ORF type:complete len:108 (+),score=25.76 TRINITY_DN34012_c0_g1_i1:41-325(+)
MINYKKVTRTYKFNEGNQMSQVQIQFFDCTDWATNNLGLDPQGSIKHLCQTLEFDEWFESENGNIVFRIDDNTAYVIEQRKRMLYIHLGDLDFF